MTWAELDWSILDRLRDGFLHGGAASGPYWKSEDDLAHYDFTYGERIGWKWDAVLGELRRRGWRPPVGPVLDWGCGSGVAGRRFLTSWPGAVTRVRVWDHSNLACAYSARRAREMFPHLEVEPAADGEGETGAILLVSHVLNELDALGRGALARAIERAAAVLWVEPGTSDVARDLVGWRERWRDTFRFVYPCPHQGACGLLQPGNERHWCHHFAPPAPGIFADANWVRFGQRAGIDLRSLPYAALVMEADTRAATAPVPAEASRILGRPEVFKPYARFLNCDRSGVAPLQFPKRLDPARHRRLDRPEADRLWVWQRNASTITSATPLAPRQEAEG